MKINIKLWASVLPALLVSCAAPRVVNISGKVTPKGNVVAGASYTANVPNRTAGLIKDIVTENFNAIAHRDSIKLDDNLTRINKAAIAYAIDPLGSGYDFYLRYGLAKRAEIGYKLAGKASVFSFQYQFMGPTGAIGQKNTRRLYGSIGLQYAGQNYKLPSLLEDLQNRLGYTFKRRDILIPLVFSYSLGNEEEYGSLAWGVAYSYSHIIYTTLPDKVFNDKNLPVTGVRNKQNYGALGGFFNLKIGYKYAYIILAFAFYYQNYGSYMLLDGSRFKYSGFTFVPSVSFQLRLGKDLKSNK